jgi:hypothetical protein
VAVEVEFLHLRDVVNGANVEDIMPPSRLKSMTPEEIETSNELNRSFALLSECRVVRVLTKRDGEADVAQLQKGDIITLAISASSRHRYMAAPQVSIGDRAILDVNPILCGNIVHATYMPADEQAQFDDTKSVISYEKHLRELRKTKLI